MACCGQRRAEAVHQISAESRLANASPTADLRLTQGTAALVRGPVTGRHYQFRDGACSQPVDPRDAAILLKSGYFQIA